MFSPAFVVWQFMRSCFFKLYADSMHFIFNCIFHQLAYLCCRTGSRYLNLLKNGCRWFFKTFSTCWSLKSLVAFTVISRNVQWWSTFIWLLESAIVSLFMAKWTIPCTQSHEVSFYWSSFCLLAAVTECIEFSNYRVT